MYNYVPLIIFIDVSLMLPWCSLVPLFLLNSNAHIHFFRSHLYKKTLKQMAETMQCALYPDKTKAHSVLLLKTDGIHNIILSLLP